MAHDAYWSAVATTVPVLALAAVVEMRRSSLLWTARDRRKRRLEGLLGLVQAVAYVWSFSAALVALGGANVDAAIPAVTIALLIALGILTVQPLLRVAARGNADTRGILAAWLDWLRMRRAARELDSILARLLTYLEVVEDIQRSTLKNIDRARADARAAREEAAIEQARMSRLPAGSLLRTTLANTAPDVDWWDDHVSALVAMAAQNDEAVERSWRDLMMVDSVATRARRLQRIARSGRPTWRYRAAVQRSLAELHAENR